MSEKTEIEFRHDVRPGDRDAVRLIVESTGAFHGYEVDVAVELVDERLEKGDASGYHFVFAESGGETIGYACYGPIACTAHSYDLYWIAVRQDLRGGGVGIRLVAECERLIALAGGRRVYIETSSRPDYDKTRSFYDRTGYVLEAELKDFYAPGDSKCVYVKALG